MTTLHRIYFDASEIDELGRYDLGIEGSREDLKRLSGLLKDGLRVVIYQTNELQMEAFLEFDMEQQQWTARPIENTTTYLDDPNRRRGTPTE